MFLSTPSEARSSRLLLLIATILVVAVLHFAKAVLIPIALAILLAFLLTPLVNRLERLGLRRIPSALIVSVLAFAALLFVGYIVASEAVSLAQSLPKYRQNIREKVQSIANGALSRASESLRQATEDVVNATTEPDESDSVQPRLDGSSRPPGTDASTPVRVEIADTRSNAFQTLWDFVHPVLGPLGMAGIIIVFVVFILIQREDLRDRLLALSGAHQMTLTMRAFDDAAERVGRYLLMQCIVNVICGIAAGVGLMLIGVPNALLWGALSVVLRYIPYIGPWIAAAIPIVLALAVFDDWTRTFLVIALFIVIELVSSNVLEPWLYGSGTGVSPMAVVLSAVFWTWLWGVPGLVLATPLTVCVVVLGRHVPQMQWLAVLLGDQTGLPLPARVYQRLLAADQDDLLSVAQEYLKDHTLLEFYEDTLLVALNMAETDRHAGSLDEQRQHAVYMTLRELIEDLGAVEAATPPVVPPALPVGPAASNLTNKPLILIVTAQDEADELAAIMLSQLLEQTGQRTQVFPTGELAAEVIERAASLHPAIICISSMPPMAISRARYITKRLHEHIADTRIVVGVWNATDVDRAKQRLRMAGGDAVVSNFTKAMETLRQ